MKKWDAVLLKAFLYGIPLLIAYAFFAYSVDWQNVERSGGYLRTIYDVGGMVLGLWMILSFSLSVRLVVSSVFRKTVLAKLTLLRERDERESFLTGIAARETMLTSIAILIFLFCLSCFQFSLNQLPPEQAVDGKTKAISIGVKFDLFAGEKATNAGESSPEHSIVAYNGLPFSTSSVIVGLLLWQIISYNYSMRRLMK